MTLTLVGVVVGGSGVGVRALRAPLLAGVASHCCAQYTSAGLGSHEEYLL